MQTFESDPQNPAAPADAAPEELMAAAAQDPDERAFPLGQILGGIALIALFLGTGTVWSTLAPVEGAVVSPGIVSVAGFRKQIQHLEGGIVEDILVRDGDRVDSGQLLIRLRDVQPAAELAQLERQHLEAQAIVARLIAERDDLKKVEFPTALQQRAQEPAVASIITGQENVLRSRRTLVRDKRSVLRHKIAQAEEEIVGLNARVRAKERQQVLIREELDSVEQALAQKLVPKSMALKLQQRMAETDGDLSGLRADIGRLRQSVLEMRLQMSEAQAQRIADITEQLRTQRAELFKLEQKIVTAHDVLRRTRITSPIDGVVVNLAVHTRDGVISAGQPLLEVVPSDDELVVNAFIDPLDIDEVRAGMPADVRLTSLSRRQRTPLEGVVADISADRLVDPQTGAEYFRARIELAPEVAASAKPDLVAGMGADVFIRTGARTTLDYLWSPIAKSLQQGMREN